MIDFGFLSEKLNNARSGKKPIKFIGYSKKIKKCQKCGKDNLSRTLIFNVNGKEKHFGSECAKLFKNEYNASSKKEPILAEGFLLALDRRASNFKKYFSKSISREFLLKSSKLIFNINGYELCDDSLTEFGEKFLKNIQDLTGFDLLQFYTSDPGTKKYSELPFLIKSGLTETEFFDIIASIFEAVQAQSTYSKSNSSNAPEFIGKFFLFKWACLGFPTLVFYTNFCTQMAFTNLSKDIIDKVKPPFNYYLIEIPDNYLVAKSSIDGSDTYVKNIEVLFEQRSNGTNKWSWIAKADDGTVLYRYGVDSHQLIKNSNNMIVHNSPLNFDIGTEDERLMDVIGKIILNS